MNSWLNYFSQEFLGKWSILDWEHLFTLIHRKTLKKITNTLLGRVNHRKKGL